MKKIAIITRGFTGCTLPLIKSLISRGYNVDLYLLTYKRIADFEAFDCVYTPSKNGLHIIEKESYKTHSYLLNENFRLFCIKLPRPLLSIPVLRDLFRIVNRILTYRICKSINKENYLWVNIVGCYFSNEYVPFVKALQVQKLTVSLHEVCNHYSPDFNVLSPLLREIKKKVLPIVVHSEKSYLDITKYGCFNDNRLSLINFGLFATWRDIPKISEMRLPCNYILFYGSVNSYKGLDVFFEAVSLIESDVNVVVAGAGYLPVLDDMKKDNRYTVINRYLSNAEIVTLISGCKFVVCPYLTVSQSGIPQTTFVFEKPIVASNLDGINDVVIDKENGLLFESGNAKELSHCIVELLTNQPLYEKCLKNVSCFAEKHPQYSWNSIIEDYIRIFNLE